MLFEQAIGAVGISTMEVRPGDTALAHGCESAAITSLAEFLDNAETTILASIDLQVHGAVGMGTQLQTASTLVEIEDNQLTFACEIHDGPRLVASALMRRNLVERVSFLARTAALSIMSQQSNN
jgi:fluoroacetyl-CoA thioesterase